jgi:hypothetical protein
VAGATCNDTSISHLTCTITRRDDTTLVHFERYKCRARGDLASSSTRRPPWRHLASSSTRRPPWRPPVPAPPAHPLAAPARRGEHLHAAAPAPPPPPPAHDDEGRRARRELSRGRELGASSVEHNGASSVEVASSARAQSSSARAQSSTMGRTKSAESARPYAAGFLKKTQLRAHCSVWFSSGSRAHAHRGGRGRARRLTSFWSCLRKASMYLHAMPTVAIRGHQRQSKVIGGH